MALARAALSEAAGNAEEARAVLQAITAGPLTAIAQWKLGLIALSGNRTSDAVGSFERALYLDSDGSTISALAFRAPGPRAQLILLYGRSGREAAAVRLAEADDQGTSTLISPAVRRALVSGVAAPESPQELSFEPSLQNARSRSTGNKTIAELNIAAAPGVSADLLGSLIESAARMEQFDRAIALARLRAGDLAKPDDRSVFEKRIAELRAAQQARQQRLALLSRIDRSNAATVIYSSAVLGK